MKKFTSLFFAIAATVAFTGCSSDGNDPQYFILDFESVPSASLAGPTAKGENLNADYEGGDPARYIGYHDALTDLEFGINEASGDYNIWNGGIFVSQWNDMEASGPDNQCSVYFKSPDGNGGRGNSKTFAVVYYSAYNPSAPAVSFKTATTELQAEGFWITNTTYAALSMEKGSDLPRKLSYEDKDWFKLIVKGYDKAGTQTGSVEAFLADFREASSPGILKEWKHIDLTELGKVHELTFTIEGSLENEWGLLIPAYFCFDDLRFRL